MGSYIGTTFRGHAKNYPPFCTQLWIALMGENDTVLPPIVRYNPKDPLLTAGPKVSAHLR